MLDRDISEFSQDQDTQFSLLLWVIPFLVAAVLFVVSQYSFLLFHALAELFAIGVALLMCVVAWQMYPFTRNNYLMYLGVGYFWIGTLDLMHMLAYKGMNLHSLTGANFSTQYWIATRGIEAFVLISAPWFLRHRLNRGLSFVLFGVVAILVIMAISLGFFPQCYIPGSGLTPFKVYGEYVIMLVLGIALYSLQHQKHLLEPMILKMISVSIVLTIVAELLFTFYIDVYGISNLLGHILKFFSFWLIFMATIHTTLKKPFQAMAKDASTYDAIPNPTIVTDDQGIVRQANQAACEMANMPKEVLLGQSAHVLFHPNFMHREECPVCSSINKGEKLDSCEVHFPATGRWQDYSVSPLPGGAVEVIRDITEKKRVENQFVELNQLKNTIVDTLPGMLFVKTADEGRYVEWNRAAEELTGIPKSEVIGKTDFDLFPQTAEFFTEMDQRVLNEGAFLDIPEESIHTRNKGVRLLHTQKVPIFDNAGHASHLLGISMDITEQRNVEKMLQQSQKMEAIGQLSGGVAHDFNNQLGMVIGFLDFLKEYVSEDKEATEWAEISLKAARRCVELTQQLLMFSRHHSTSKEIFDINERIEEISSMIERSLTAANEVQFQLAADSLITMANPGEFQDALLNLAINARDAMPKGGCYQISTMQITLDGDHASPYGEIPPGKYVRISLSDTGTGMAQEVMEHIFEPFYTTKPKGKGTGLGLAMVYAFTRRYGGGIIVDSTLGNGTTFHLFLPVYVLDEPDSNAGSDSLTELPGGSETILLVDDEVNLLKLAKTYLTSAGYTVLTAENALQALEVLQQLADVDLVLSDIVMPGGVDGYELASEAEKRRPGIKVLLTSGHAIEDETARRDDYWVKSILKKPYSKTELLQAVRQVLDRDNS